MAADVIAKVTDATFEQAVQSDKPVLVDFWQSGVGHAKCWRLFWTKLRLKIKTG